MFWITEKSVNIESNVNLTGNIIMAVGGVEAEENLLLDGRLLSVSGALTLDKANFSKPTGNTSISINSLDKFVLFTGNSTISNTISGGTGDAGSFTDSLITLPNLDGTIWGVNDGLVSLYFELINNGVTILNSARSYITTSTIVTTNSIESQISLSAVTDAEVGDNLSVKLTNIFGISEIKDRNSYISHIDYR